MRIKGTKIITLALGDEDNIAVPLYKNYNGMLVKEQRTIFWEK